MSECIRFGVIGCGGIGNFHAKSINAAEGACLVAVCDIIEEKAIKFADKYGVKKIYTNYKEMLNDGEIDAVTIATPSGIHGEMCIAAADNNKHILCEKPIEITTEKINSLIEGVRKNKVKVACVFQRRFEKTFLTVKQAVMEDKLGKIVLADAYLKYYRDQAYYDSGIWRGTWELDGGGALMNQGVHGIDILLWLVGDVESVTAITRTQLRKIEVEDTAIALIKFKNGAIGVVEGATSVYPAQDTRFEIHGEKGSIIFGDAGIIEWKMLNSEDVAPIVEGATETAKDDPMNLADTPHLDLINDLVDAIKTDRAPFVEPEEGRKAVDLILAIYKSSKAGGKEVLL
jgi:predicted dehydrogenase